MWGIYMRKSIIALAVGAMVVSQPPKNIYLDLKYSKPLPKPKVKKDFIYHQKGKR